MKVEWDRVITKSDLSVRWNYRNLQPLVKIFSNLEENKDEWMDEIKEKGLSSNKLKWKNSSHCSHSNRNKFNAHIEKDVTLNCFLK